MGFLLDSHVLIWWWTNSPRLSELARQTIGDERNEVFVSAATAWELAIKQNLGKLNGIPTIDGRYSELLAADGFQSLPINELHALRAAGFASPHSDPFDRMLAAQSELERLVLISKDDAFADFPCTTLW